MPLESAKCHVIDLLSDNPNKEEEEMINYFYIDKPNFILNKLKYFCKIISYYKKGKSLEQNMLFFFGPTIISTTTRSDLFKDDKIIFVCQY